ncbi:macrophage mannose receptor 1-like [Pimephales promelas]|uniref:macrophage mannose receptor 1-like n=1 Tax=Pimephales promelas TaxID=90988 RepID=UPI001955CE0A|nr:macrophage mannose receptor 1-like [Pimephales promelas]
MKTTLAVLLILQLYGLSSGLFKQHYFVNEEKKWDSARQHCKDLFQELSTFTTQSEEQQFLEDAVGQTSDAWVGLHKESGVWKWAGGEDATRISWDSSNLLVPNEKCAFIHSSSKKLHDEQCNVKLKFFCMKTFVLVLKNESWEGALEYCRKHHNDLASLKNITSASEEIALSETGYVWTGLRFLAGEWRWVDGDDLDFTAWPQTGLPQCPERNLRCGALDLLTEDWTHRDCEEKLNFFCQ